MNLTLEQDDIESMQAWLESGRSLEFAIERGDISEALIDRFVRASLSRQSVAPTCPFCPKETPYGPATCAVCTAAIQSVAVGGGAGSFDIGIVKRRIALMLERLSNGNPDYEAIRALAFEAGRVLDGFAVQLDDPSVGLMDNIIHEITGDEGEDSCFQYMRRALTELMKYRKDDVAAPAGDAGAVYQVNHIGVTQSGAIWCDVSKEAYDSCQTKKRILHTHPAPAAQAAPSDDYKRMAGLWNSASNEAFGLRSQVLHWKSNHDRVVAKLAAIRATPSPALLDGQSDAVQSRGKFEQLAKSRGYSLIRDDGVGGLAYSNNDTHSAWLWWRIAHTHFAAQPDHADTWYVLDQVAQHFEGDSEVRNGNQVAEAVRALHSTPATPSDSVAARDDYPCCVVCANKIGAKHERAMCRAKHDVGMRVTSADCYAQPSAAPAGKEN